MPQKGRELIKAKEAEWGRTELPNARCQRASFENPRDFRKAGSVKGDGSPISRPRGSKIQGSNAVDPKTVDPLIASFRNRDKTERKKAAENLARIGRPAVAPLICALDDRVSYVRALAAYALGNIGDPRALNPLKKALQDKDSSVRKEAKEALIKLGDQ